MTLKILVIKRAYTILKINFIDYLIVGFNNVNQLDDLLKKFNENKIESI